MSTTFVNEAHYNLVNVPIWVGMGLLNFALGIILFVQFYIVFFKRDDRDIVFPFSRSLPGTAFAVFVISALMFFMGTAMSRGSAFSFTFASVTLFALMLAFLIPSGWVRKSSAVANDAYLIRAGLFVAAFSSFIAVVCSPSSVTRFFLAPLTVYIISGMILTESHFDVVVDRDQDTGGSGSASCKNDSDCGAGRYCCNGSCLSDSDICIEDN